MIAVRSEPSEVLNARELAAFLGVSERKAHYMIARREVPTIELGRFRRVPRKALEKWLVERTEAAR